MADEEPIRYYHVRVEATGYATVMGRSKEEAIEKARAGDYIGTPLPEWEAVVSDVKLIEREEEASQ